MEQFTQWQAVWVYVDGPNWGRPYVGYISEVLPDGRYTVKVQRLWDGSPQEFTVEARNLNTHYWLAGQVVDSGNALPPPQSVGSGRR